jgi:hypothetical protein
MLFPISGAGKKPAKEVAKKQARAARRRKAADRRGFYFRIGEGEV